MGDAVLLNIIKRTRLHAGPGELDAGLIERTKPLLPFAGIGINDDLVYQSLIGWCQELLLRKWQQKQEGWIEVSAFNSHAYTIVENMKRQAIQPRAERLLPVSEDDKSAVRSDRFVTHLGMIDLADDWLDEEISHYIRFSKEKFRLTESGNVLEDHWSERGDRLKQKWQTIRRDVLMNHGSETKAKIGQLILNDSSKINESLADSEISEKYMTMGHYHRLADNDRIAWHPDFKCVD